MMSENPYQPPSAEEIAASESTGLLSAAVVLPSIVLRIIFRFFGVAFAVLLLLIYLKGTMVNWSNAGPILIVIAIGCLATHVAAFKTKQHWANVTFGPCLYLAGIGVAGFVFVTGLYPAGL